MSPLQPPSATPTPPLLLLFGAGRHGRVVADAALLENSWERIVASDRDPAACQQPLLPGVEILELEIALGLHSDIHVAIGNNLSREREGIFLGVDRLVCVVHPAANVSPFSQRGSGCFIAAGAVVAPGARLGRGVIVNHGAVVDHDVQVGDFSHIAPNATLGGAVSVGRRVLIGAGAVVLPSMVVSDDVIVGAGAVVIHPLTAPGTYAGVPARKIQ